MYDEGKYFPSSNVKSRIFRDCFMMFWEWSSVTGALCSGPGTRCTSPCHSDANVSSRPRIAGILCRIMKLSSNFHRVSKVIKYNNTTDWWRMDLIHSFYCRGKHCRDMCADWCTLEIVTKIDPNTVNCVMLGRVVWS